MQVSEKNYVFEPTSNPFLSFEHIKTPCEIINHLNLNRVKTKSTHETSGYGWSVEKAHQIGELYRAFIFLCWKYPENHIIPTKEIDEFWHLHILDTRNYKEDCEKIFGYYLHHFPYAGLEGTEHVDEESMKKNTLALVKKHFPALLL